MKSKRTFLVRAGTLLVLLLIAGAMFIVGRGHTIYFDNKTFEYEGISYTAPYKAVVYDNDKEIAVLLKRERGMATWLGQNFKMALEVTLEKGGEAVTYPLQLKLPYRMDGVVLNLPAMLAGLPEEIYMSEFVSQIAQTDIVEEVVIDELVPADI